MDEITREPEQSFVEDYKIYRITALYHALEDGEGYHPSGHE